jgi:hypothetical protein
MNIDEKAHQFTIEIAKMLVTINTAGIGFTAAISKFSQFQMSDPALPIIVFAFGLIFSVLILVGNLMGAAIINNAVPYDKITMLSSIFQFISNHTWLWMLLALIMFVLGALCLA